MELLQNPYVAGVVTGIISAAGVDLVAFRSWKSFDDASQYDWYLAAWRWFQGATFGLLSTAGIAGLAG